MTKKITRTTKVSLYESADGTTIVRLIGEDNTAENVRELYDEGYRFVEDRMTTFSMDARSFYEAALITSEKGVK